jgi:steroid delta-isomerase-like uncharacterized protein
VNREWAQRWITSFGRDPEEGASYYADDFIFEDAPLEQFIQNDKAELLRCFGPYANQDPDNGVGIHSFNVTDYRGDENSGFITWEWDAKHCAVFLGLPTNGKDLHTTGITGHVYADGKVTREWTHSDQVTIFKQLGVPAKTPHYWEAGWTPESA